MVFAGYYHNRNVLKDFERSVIFAAKGNDNMPKSSGINDPTAAAALAIAENPRMAELSREIKAVDKVLRQLPDYKAALLRRLYLSGKRYTLEGAAMQEGISLRTAIRWKKQAARLLAGELGWID